MTSAVLGASSTCSLYVVGRSTLGLGLPETLAVDAQSNLAIDGTDDLDVFVGVSWSGIDATTRVIVEGATLGELGSF